MRKCDEMPVKIPENLPAAEILKKENIFIMKESRAFHQDIRPLRIAILNLMPDKIRTETQLIRLISNSPLQVEIILLHPKTHISANTPGRHLEVFYKNYEQIKTEKMDGLIITGAPVEHLEFTEVDYWNELTEIMNWSLNNVYSVLHICWAAQAGLYHHYGIKKHPLAQKLFGIFKHRVTKKHLKLFKGFDDIFYTPHSRYSEVRKADIIKNNALEILSESHEAGVHTVATKDRRQIFITGHSEYDPLTLKEEYERDLKKGINVQIPKNYFPCNDTEKNPLVMWRAHANLLFSNWLNYCVYQKTPYNLDTIGKT